MLPSYMIETLLGMKKRLGYGPERIIGLVRNLKKAQTRFKNHLHRGDFILVEGDVANPVAIDGPIDFIIHAAGAANTRDFLLDPAGTLSANILGCHHTLELGRAKQSRSVLFFSSGEVCGVLGSDQMPMKEDVYGPLDPDKIESCYAEAKRACECMCVSWTAQHGLPTKIVRPFHTYGPGLNLKSGQIFSDFISDVMAGRDLTIKSSGLATRSFCYLGDATLAYFYVLLKGKPAFPYNVGTGVETSIRELATILASEFADRGIKVVIKGDTGPAIPQPQHKRSSPDITRLRGLGWEPLPRSRKDSVARCAAWNLRKKAYPDRQQSVRPALNPGGFRRPENGLIQAGPD